jgi:hypothetical protein
VGKKGGKRREGVWRIHEESKRKGEGESIGKWKRSKWEVKCKWRSKEREKKRREERKKTGRNKEVTEKEGKIYAKMMKEKRKRRKWGRKPEMKKRKRRKKGRKLGETRK